MGKMIDRDLTNILYREAITEAEEIYVLPK